MMLDDNLPGMPELAVLTSADFLEINQLADLLFDPRVTAIRLQSEHPLATQAWIASALYASDLVKKNTIQPAVLLDTKAAWSYSEEDGLVRKNRPSTAQYIVLTLPSLSFAQRILLLQHYCQTTLHTHLLTIPVLVMQTALTWQMRYSAEQTVLAQTILVLQRAARRFMLTHPEERQATALEIQQIADILVDWHYVSARDLRHDTTDAAALKQFLSDHMVGQHHAIEQFLQKKASDHFFLLAGPAFSGKQAFAEYYACFTHAAKHFCFTWNLSFFEAEVAWSAVMLPSPRHSPPYIRLTEIIAQYPQAIIVLTQGHKNPALLARLQQEIKRSFLVVDERYLSLQNITWMLLFDTEVPDVESVIHPEAILHDHFSSGLTDLLYRPNLSPTSFLQEESVVPESLIIEAVRKKFTSSVVEQAHLIIFSPLSEKSKKIILNKELNRIIQYLRDKYSVALYFQEEIVFFLLHHTNQEGQGFQELHQTLGYHIEHMVLQALQAGSLVDEQGLMLQLNTNGHSLQLVRTALKTGAAKSRAII